MKKFPENIGVYFLIATGLFVLAAPFIQDFALRLSSSLILAFMPYAVFRSAARTASLLRAREQLKCLLEQLCVHVSEGKPLGTALLDVRPELSAVFGERSIVEIALKGYEDQIAAGVAQDAAILALAARIPCPEATALFHAVSDTKILGNRILEILQRSHSMVGDLLTVTRDISSDVSQKRLESAVMSLMPLLVTWSLALTVPSYLVPAYANFWGRLLMLSAFFLTVAGYCLGCRIVTDSVFKQEKSGETSGRSSLVFAASSLFFRFIKPYPKRFAVLEKLGFLMPEGYRLSLRRMLVSSAYPRSPLGNGSHCFLEEYLFIKVFLLLICTSGYIVLSVFLPVPFLFYIAAAVLLLFLHDLDAKRLVERSKAQLMRDFPTFIGLLCTLLGNGVVLAKALLLCTDALRNLSGAFQKELSLLRGTLSAGTPPYEALEKMASRCQIPEVACALQFAARFEKTGGLENLNFLRLQSSACWAQSKVAAHRQLNESSVKLLFPMMLHLICVMAVTVTPSILSIQAIS